jgi:hypothetical protein
MGNVTFIVGYCGSGKSHIADQMELKGVLKFDEGFINDPNQQTQLIQALRSNRDCVVVEIFYGLDQHRQAIIRKLDAELQGVIIEWIAFEADIEKANQNCRRRTNKGDPETHVQINNNVIGLGYKVRPGVIPRPIFQIPKPETK